MPRSTIRRWWTGHMRQQSDVGVDEDANNADGGNRQHAGGADAHWRGRNPAVVSSKRASEDIGL